MNVKTKNACLRIIGKLLGLLFCINGICALIASKDEKRIVAPAILFLILGAFLWFISRRKSANYKDSDIYLSKEQINRLEKNQEIPVVQTPLFLKPGEVAVFYCKATRQESTNRVVGKQGGYGGVSFHITKKLTLHSGNIDSTPVYGDVYSHFPGSFVMTTERLVFINDKKGFEVPYGAITAFQGYADGITIQVKNVTYVLLLPRPDLINVIFSAIRDLGTEKFAERMTRYQPGMSKENTKDFHRCSCGAPIDESMRFCSACGAPVAVKEESSAEKNKADHANAGKI